MSPLLLSHPDFQLFSLKSVAAKKKYLCRDLAFNFLFTLTSFVSLSFIAILKAVAWSCFSSSCSHPQGQGWSRLHQRNQILYLHGERPHVLPASMQEAHRIRALLEDAPTSSPSRVVANNRESVSINLEFSLSTRCEFLIFHPKTWGMSKRSQKSFFQGVHKLGVYLGV